MYELWLLPTLIVSFVIAIVRNASFTTAIIAITIPQINITVARNSLHVREFCRSRATGFEDAPQLSLAAIARCDHLLLRAGSERDQRNQSDQVEKLSYGTRELHRASKVIAVGAVRNPSGTFGTLGPAGISMIT